MDESGRNLPKGQSVYLPPVKAEYKFNALKADFITSAHVRHSITEIHSGPLPPARELEAYTKIGDGEVLALVLKMAEQNNNTQNVLARRAQGSSFFSDSARTIVGLIFGGYCVYKASILAEHGHIYIAGLLATTTLLIGLGVLVMRILPKTHSIKKENKEEGKEEE